MSAKSEFINIIKERGFLHQCTDTDTLDALLAKEKATAYIGFDCTAPSLHVGSLMQIMILRWLQKCGHRPLVLMGGGTTKIGDPSGKDEARKMLTEADINANMAGIKTVFKNFIRFEEDGGNALMLNNDDWLKDLNYISFLRDYGRHFSVNRMMSMDSVKLRLEREQNLSFLEFNYMILQAYDFVELNKRYACRLQIGGSDQWGNIVNGVELHRRLDASAQENVHQHLFGLTTPLITTSSGAKMGKTASGAVWLNADMLSPFDYWQFWRNTEDADVGRFLCFFTELPMDEIARLEALEGAEINEAKKVLANEATKLCHGEEAARIAAETARKTFEEGGAGDNLKTFLVEESELKAGIPAYELFFVSGLKPSKGEARKLVEGGGARVNDEKLSDPRVLINMEHLKDGRIKLSSGKKQHLLIKVK
ncbi:MAG TPA: tyrosine--tRNA ligase [Rickettsiales bacterium]|nr:tyrosine--tRNA ligase [Rickettsiales bacterium]